MSNVALSDIEAAIHPPNDLGTHQRFRPWHSSVEEGGAKLFIWYEKGEMLMPLAMLQEPDKRKRTLSVKMQADIVTFELVPTSLYSPKTKTIASLRRYRYWSPFKPSGDTVQVKYADESEWTNILGGIFERATPHSNTKGVMYVTQDVHGKGDQLAWKLQDRVSVKLTRVPGGEAVGHMMTETSDKSFKCQIPVSLPREDARDDEAERKQREQYYVMLFAAVLALPLDVPGWRASTVKWLKKFGREVYVGNSSAGAGP